MSTKVLRCVCTHDYQDRLYGAGMRLFNRMVPTTNSYPFRCTACGREQSFIKEKEKKEDKPEKGKEG